MVMSSPMVVEPGKVEGDLAFLMTCFREVLEEAGEHNLAQILPWQERSANHAAGVPLEQLVQAMTIAFTLLGMVEQNAAVQYRRHMDSEHGLTAVRALWGQGLQELREHGLSDRQIAELLPRMQVEPVLTAHPTEAKRATVLEHHRRLYILLVQRENQMWTPYEQQIIRDEIKAVLDLLWRTGEVFLEKPDVAAERRNIIYYLRRVFPDVLPVLDQRLRQAWEEQGFDLNLIRDANSLPRLRFGTWVGGDRDGHPLVTAEVTRQTLHELRLHALSLLHEQLIELVRRLSLSSYLQPPPTSLLDWITTTAEQLGPAGQKAVQRNPDEPWRQIVNLMLERLPIAGDPNDHIRLRDNSSTYRHAAELSDDLERLYQSLLASGARRVADDALQPVMRSVQTSGFHLAKLDIRQNSRVHDLAVAQLLQAAGMQASDFPAWDEQRRLDFLNTELQSPRPFTRPDIPVGPEAHAVLSCYRVVVDYIDTYGDQGLGALIISMTRSLSDLLVVYLLAREVGLATYTAEGLVCRLPVVPLFETIDDLRHSPDILGAFLDHAVTRRSLAHQTGDPDGTPVQQVMIGYSDSNKDGGIFASLWGLYQAQATLARVGEARGVRVRFFHGRGGTISRGAGPVHRFIKALPHAALNGDLRITEQGETIAQKYANRIQAAYHLELLQASVTRTTLLDWHRPEPTHPLEPTMDWLASESRRRYIELLHTDGFLAFFRQATPIDVIEQSRIGSRPARRTGQQTLADLRAIPWVFSWGQARFYLSGWYGVGSALEALQTQDAAAFELLQQHLLTWPPLHYILSNAATSIAIADPELMRTYAALVEDNAIRERVLDLIMREYDRTRHILELFYGGPLAVRRPNVHSMVQIRQAGLRVLHQQQISLLRQWRSLQQMDNHAQAEAMLPHLLLTINALATGLGSTG